MSDDPQTGELPKKLHPIAEHYRRQEAAQAKELDDHLAAGKPIGTFNPRTLID